MIEFIKHTLGFCGEGHPSILWLLSTGGVIYYYFKHNIQWCWKQGCSICKAKLKKLTVKERVKNNEK